jgi:serine protease Do
MRYSFLSILFFLLSITTLVPASYSQNDDIEYAEKLSQVFERVAENIAPSVVTISTTVKPKNTPKGPRYAPNDPLAPFRDFFGENSPFAPFGSPFQDQDGQPRSGMGTGFIVDQNGHIVTNNHVIAGSDEVNVIFKNDRRVKAKVIGTDPRTDLAVLKIANSKREITAAKLGDSDTLKIGQWVIAAGNPFGLSNSITAGIVSAKGRSVIGGGQFEDFIQTDAAINPGNSGGPLVNLRGEVVGINSAIISRSGGYMGVGLSIPINLAKGVINSLIKTGKVVRGWLGVGIQPVSEDAAQSFGYDKTEGALIGHIEKESPADKAGLKQGDIITAIDSKSVLNVNELRNTIASLKPGTNLSLTIFRDGKNKEVSVKIGELKRSEEEVINEIESNDATAELGFSADELTPQTIRQLGIKRSQGLVVTDVKPGSLAAEAGLMPRDIIVSINGVKVKTNSELSSTLNKANLKRGIRIVVETQGMERFVFIKSSEE